MSSPVRVGSVDFPDLFRWLESPTPMSGGMPVRLEDYLDGGDYVLRAELPGMDPERDIVITVQGDALTIAGERSQRRRDGGRSEFRYGKFSRSVTLPAGADTEHISAAYEAGVLQVTVPLRAGGKAARQIPVTAHPR